MPPLPFPLDSSEPATIALTAIYGIISIFSYGYFAIWSYLPYLSSALGAGGKFLGFLLRAIFLKTLNVDVYAASTVFITAGMSSCTSAQAVVLSDWFRNSSAAHQLGFHSKHPRVLIVLTRLISIPVIIFGPGIGVPAAILMFGVKTPDAIKHANRLRKWSAWGTMACLAVLATLVLLAFTLTLTTRKQKNSRKQLVPVGLTLLSILLISLSGASRVHALYDSYFFVEDRYFYTLVALPELLQQLISSVPALMVAAGHADRYRGWRTATRPWVRRRFSPKLGCSEVQPDGEEGKSNGCDPKAGPALPASDSAKALEESLATCSQSSCDCV